MGKEKDVTQGEKAKEPAVLTEEDVRQIIALERSRIGVEIYNGPGWHEDVTGDAIRLFSHGIGDDNLLYNDEEYAKKTRWGALIAPPGFLAATAAAFGRYPMLPAYLDNQRDKKLGRSDTERVHGKPWETPGGRKVHSWNKSYLWPGYHDHAERTPGPKGAATLLGGMSGGFRFEFYEVLKKGDKVRIDARLASVEEKRGRMGGEMLKRTYLHNYWNQDGRIVARTYSYNFMALYNRVRYPARQGAKNYEYTADELKKIKEDILKADVRGANPRYWEDVNEGDAITPRVLGPIVMSDLIAWDAGQGPHTTALEPAKRWRKPEDLLLDSHHADAATGIESGFGGVIAQAECATGWTFPTITNWMGDDAFLGIMDVQLRKPLLLHDTVWFEGRVTRKFVEGGWYHNRKVEVEFWGKNQVKEDQPGGGIVYVGRAIVELPSKGPEPSIRL